MFALKSFHLAITVKAPRGGQLCTSLQAMAVTVTMTALPATGMTLSVTGMTLPTVRMTLSTTG
jgi:hypothetical protein